MSMSKLFVAGIAATAIVAGSAAARSEPLSLRHDNGLTLVADATQADERGDEFVALSHDGYRAIHEVMWARLAIFEGHPAKAEKLLRRAQESLAEAAKVAGKLTDKAKSSPGMTYIPIDARLVVADDLVYTPEKIERLKKVDAHLKKGESKEAMEELRGGGVLINVAIVLLPLEATQKAVDKAASLVAEGKYYEANMVLKQAEEGTIVDSRSLVDVFKVQPAETEKG